MNASTVLQISTPILQQPQALAAIIAAAIAGLVALIALIVNTAMATLQYRHNLNQIKETKRKELRDHLRSQLDDFYGPLWHYLMTLKGIYKMFRANKPRGFRTLTYLLDPNQKYDVDGSQVTIVLTEADRRLLAEILDIASKIEMLILDKAGLVDNSTLMTTYTPTPSITDVDPNAFKEMGLLAILLTHFRVLRLAIDGSLSGELLRYKDFVYPRELDLTVRTHMDSLREKLESLSN